MFRKIIIISAIFILLFSSVSALCGDYICEQDETSENCCIDCGCSFGEECYENECTKSVTFFSFTSEISIFLLILIVILVAFVIGYGVNIVVEAHKKTDEHLERKRQEIRNTRKPLHMEVLRTPEEIKAKIIRSIKEGKTIKEIKKELLLRNVNPSLADELLVEVIENLITKYEQGLLSVEWDPRVVECVFREVMQKPVHHRKRRVHHKDQYTYTNRNIPKDLFQDIKPPKPKPISIKQKSITQVEEYIGIALARGYSRDDIKSKLKQEGWYPEEIDKILDKITKRKSL